MSVVVYRRCPPPVRAVRASPYRRSQERIVGAGIPSSSLTARMDRPPPLPRTRLATDAYVCHRRAGSSLSADGELGIAGAAAVGFSSVGIQPVVKHLSALE